MSKSAAFLFVMIASASMVDAAFYVPTPQGSINTSKPHEVRVGGQVLEVSSYLTEMQEDELIKFYNTVLPPSGWRISKLPWQAQHEKITRKFQQNYSIHSDAPNAKQMKAQLDQYQEASNRMRRQIYAEHESEYVIINLMPRGNRMAIFINRWSGQQARWIPQAKGVSQSGSPVQSQLRLSNNPEAVQANPSEAIYKDPGITSQGNEWLKANVCCTGEGIADQKSAMPLSIPLYPGANAVAKSTSADKKHITVILESTDSLKEVVAYYRRHMSYNGWTLLNLKRLHDEGFGIGRKLSYRKPDRHCYINFQPVGNEQNEEVFAEGDPESSSIKTVMTFKVISDSE